MRLRKIVKKLLGRRRGEKPSELSTPTIHREILDAIDKAAPDGLEGDFLDVGSGILLFPLIKLTAARTYNRELRKFRTIDEQNDRLIRSMNSRAILLGRTLIVTARKP